MEMGERWLQNYKKKQKEKKLKKVEAKKKAEPVRGLTMSRDKYTEYLFSNWWKSKRKQKLGSVNYLCEKCGSNKQLQVHHLHYKSLGREKNTDLQVLCRACHEYCHDGLIGMESHLDSISNGNY